MVQHNSNQKCDCDKMSDFMIRCLVLIRCLITSWQQSLKMFGFDKMSDNELVAVFIVRQKLGSVRYV